MPQQLPTLSNTEQYQLLEEIRTETLYSYMFRFNKLANSTNFPALDPTVSGVRYFKFTFTAPTSLALIAMQVTAVVNPTTTEYLGAIVTYNNGTAVTIADNTTVTVPDDSGNDIYRSFFLGNYALDDYILFKPNNYYLAKGQSLYFFCFADAALITAAANTVVGAWTLHTRPTGLLV